MISLRSIFDPEIVPEEWLLERMRIQRDRLLAESDYTQAHDDPTGNHEAWATYRQQLRDFPATWTPAETADFPNPPT